jgi:hypothetical protein
MSPPLKTPSDRPNYPADMILKRDDHNPPFIETHFLVSSEIKIIIRQQIPSESWSTKLSQNAIRGALRFKTQASAFSVSGINDCPQYTYWRIEIYSGISSLIRDMISFSGTSPIFGTSLYFWDKSLFSGHVPFPGQLLICGL